MASPAIKVLDQLRELSEYIALENVTVQIDNILDVVTPGLSLLNTTASDATNTRQNSPVFLMQASAWDSGDEESKPQLAGIFLNGDDGNQAFLNFAFGDSVENLSSLFQFGNDGTFYTDGLQVNGNFSCSNIDLGNGVVLNRDGSDSVVLRTTTNTDPVWLKFNGVSASFPGIKRSGTELHFKLANDSAFTNIRFNTVVAGTWQGSAIADGFIASAATWNAKEDAANKAVNFSTVNDALYPSVAAVKAYADALVVGLIDDRGNYDASGNAFPSSGGSGTAGAILKGDLWLISVAGTLGGVAVAIGDQVRALVDTPGQTSSNWAISEANIGYVPENVANKATGFSTLNNTLYPTTQAVANYAQQLDSDLTAIAALTPTNDDVMQFKSGAWANRTITQLKSDLSLSGTNTGDQTISDVTISLTDIVTNNVSTLKHGFAPKGDGDTSKFLNANGAYSVPGGVSLSAANTWTALQTFATGARSSGVARYFTIQTPADTSLTASTESIGVQVGGDSSAATVIRQHATGALTTQREYVFVAPTYSFVGASTVTTAATVAITGEPVLGTNATFTNRAALLISQSAENGQFIRLVSSHLNTGGTTYFPFALYDSGLTLRAGIKFITGSGDWRFIANANGGSRPCFEVGDGSGSGLGSASPDLLLLSQGSVIARLNGTTGDFQPNGSFAIGFGSSGADTPDLFLKRYAAASLQLGKTAGSPVNQTLKAHDGTGSNIAGASLSIASGIGTGTGNPGNITLQIARPKTSSSTLNTLDDQIKFQYATDSIEQLWQLKTSTTALQDAAKIAAVWATNTHASRSADFVVSLVNSAAALAEKFRIKADSRMFFGTPNSAPTDGDIGNGFVTAYLDQTLNILNFRVRYSDGTLKTGSIALT